MQEQGCEGKMEISCTTETFSLVWKARGQCTYPHVKEGACRMKKRTKERKRGRKEGGDAKK